MDFIVIAGAEYLIYLLLIAFVYWVYSRGSNRMQVIVVTIVSAIVVFALSRLFSSLIDNPRPFTEGLTPLFYHVSDNGFPSDHTLVSATIAFIIYVYNKRLGMLFLAGALTVGLCRVLANVHHLEDILGAVAIAGLSGYASYALTKKLAAKHRHPKS
jgi:undecaprenyl-diphosphatase